MKKNYPAKFVCYIFLILMSFVIIFPIYVTFVTAFKTAEESTANFFSLPRSLYLGNFQSVMSDPNFSHYVTNSVLITAISITLIAFTVPMVSYAIARTMARHKYFTVIYVLILLSIFAPFQVLMVPLTQLTSRLGLQNQFGLILVYTAFALGQGVFLFVAYYKSIPLELEEAAIIDGCSTSGTFFRIVFPLAKPMMITVVILDVLWIWNDFMLPLLLLNKSAENWTLPLYQYNFKSSYTFDYNLAFASFLFSIIPMMIVYICLQKYIIAGLTAGAVKG